MKVSRAWAVRIQYLLDNWVPPGLRDSRLFMYLPMRLVLKDVTSDFMGFKDHVFGLTPTEFGQLYERTAHVQELQGETDLNDRCVEELVRVVAKARVLDVGCGRGYLANRLQLAGSDVTGCDIVLPDGIETRYPRVRFRVAGIESLPFEDESFDVVVCTHTLEHVQNLPVAIAELRRVARRLLVIVVPKQRPYKYTFSLHTQFFPYAWSIQGALGYREDATIRYLGDWFYCESDPHA